MRVKDILLVSDIDGTIIPVSGRISERNLNAIEKFKKIGGSFALATGRVPSHAKDVGKILMGDGAMICANGSMIFNLSSGKIEWNACFSSSDNNILAGFDRIVEVCRNATVLMIDTNQNFYKLHSSSGGEEKFEYANELEKGTIPPNCPSGVIVLDNENDLHEVCLNLLGLEEYGLRVTVSGHKYLDILPARVSKGYPLERLANEFYGKKLENTVAIGDFDNDIEMIRNAALGVAVANAQPSVKAVADMVLQNSCENDGLAELIDYLISNEN